MVLLRISSRLRLIIDPKPISRNRRKSQASITSIFLFRIFIKPRSECSRGRDPPWWIFNNSISQFPFSNRMFNNNCLLPLTISRPPSFSSLLSISKQKKNQQTTSHMVGVWETYWGCLWPLFQHERPCLLLPSGISTAESPVIGYLLQDLHESGTKHPEVKR